MKNKDMLLAIDNGTQSLKAIVFDLNGQIVAKEAVVFEEPYFSKNPGWAEQDPKMFWSSLCSACQRLWNVSKVDKSRIAGVSVTTQRASAINVDKAGNALRPAILWPDQRKTYGLPRIRGIWGAMFRIAGLSGTIAHLQSEAEANWIRTYQPEIWKKTHKYLLLSGFLNYKLTGKFVDSVGSQVGYIPFDYKKKEWASKWSWRWECLKITPSMVAELVEPAKIMGEITSKAAEETGIPAGLPVIAGAADKACETIGSGSLDSYTACLSYGTAATINVTHKKYVESIPMIPPYPSAAPDYYTLEVQVYRGYWMVTWFKEQFGHPEQEEAAKEGLETEILFDRLVEDIPPGSMGLILQPYWNSGLKSPGPEAKGAIIGFGDIHTRAHLYKSILEGLAYALREGKERIEKKTDVPITNIIVSGGGSQSKNAMQITADIFGLPTARPKLYDTSCLGAAIEIAVGLGFYKNFEQAVKNMTEIGDVFEPDIKAHDIYDAIYRDVYKKMYKKLKPFYKRIREITQYPK